MKLSVFVQGRDVAVLDPAGDFKSVLTYHANTAEDDLVSLTMPVRTESWVWDDTLPPVLQMNLPEGYLLQVLQEQFGPHIGANPTALLSVVGRNMVGRVQVAAPGANLDESAKPFEVATVLQGDNSEAAFAELVREHAASGVSGIVPKFLDTRPESARLGPHQKAALLTRRHIVKGSSHRLPFVALNEHLCMQVAAKMLPAATTEISDDGQALVVTRFDVDETGQLHWGLEDFCALLGLRPAAKYETTWERIARAVHDHVPGERQRETFRRLTKILLLTYALRNADCHAKNVALLYTSRTDVQLAPVYDMLTTRVYADYQNNPPGIAFMGKKTWKPGKNLPRFIAATFGIPLREQVEIVESITQAVREIGLSVHAAIGRHTAFADVGYGMLLTWQQAITALRGGQTYGLGEPELGDAFAGLPNLNETKQKRPVSGRSELLGKRS